MSLATGKSGRHWIVGNRNSGPVSACTKHVDYVRAARHLDLQATFGLLL